MILTYLIKSTLCLGILFGFYKIALENKAMHRFKRFYLLASLVFAFTIPLVTFTYTTTVSQEALEEQWVQGFAQGYEESPVSSPQVVQPETDYTNTIIWSLYGLGVLIFGIRFGLNLVRLKRKISTAQLFEERDFTIALLGKAIVPHSFFKWIFLNKNQYLNQEIAPEVIAHEATHVRQKHSWDILFVEFLQVVFWFNPLVWLSNISIKLNHEFLADQGAIIDKSNIAIYQNILLSYASSAHHTALESPFNYSLTKKRVVMLSQSFSRKKLLVRSLLLIPVLGLCILFFNQGIVAQAIESDHNTLIGQWIDQKTETAFIDIYEENNTLWADLQNVKFSLQKDSKGYYIEDKNFNRGAKFYLSTDTSGNLKFGDRKALLIPSSKSIKKSIQGAWYNSSTGSTYIFSTENGITCDVLKKGEKPIRYWPILKDGGVSFTMGYDWVSFKREGKDLVFFDTHKQTYRLQRSGEYTTLNQTDETPSERINTTTQNPQSYTTQFLEGAKRNGKKPIVIELRNNKIYVNGTYTSIENLRATVDAVTANWSNEDYKDPTRSFLFKGNSVDFLKRAGAEFQKTNFSKVNGDIKLAPPPFAPSVAPSTSTEAHFKKMKNLNGLFFYEGTPVSYETAIHLAQANKNLNFKTPYPYSNPPETHLSKSPINGIPQQTNTNKKGDTLVITLVDTGQKALAVMDNAIQGTIIDQPALTYLSNNEKTRSTLQPKKVVNDQIFQTPAKDSSDIDRFKYLEESPFFHQNMEVLYQEYLEILKKHPKFKAVSERKTDVNQSSILLQKEVNPADIEQTTPFEDQIQSNTTTQNPQSYTTKFLEGAKRNGKKPLVIEIRNDKIKINGKQSSLSTFQKDVDTTTEDWKETDYTSPARSYVFKGNTPEFLKKLEEEYAKTHISKANGSAKLVPLPAPPPPQTIKDLPVPPPPSVEDHLFKMNRLGGEFYFNDTKITYAEAKKLIEDYEDLNIKTPFPYTTPPQTFLTKQTKQKPKLKIGDTLTITVIETGQKHEMISQEEPSDHATQANVKRELDKVGKLNLKYISQKPATKKEIAIYNKLATKYNKDPEGIIKQVEVGRMYDIYSRMTPKQKKTAQPYPTIPPPPLVQRKANPAVVEQAKPFEEQIRSNTNPKKFFVEVKDNSLRINGEIVPLKDFAKRIDEKTKSWTEEDFQNQKTAEVLLAKMSFDTRIDENFRIAYKEEMSKSNYYKKIGRYGFPSYSFVQHLFSWQEKYLKKNNYIIYYNNEKVTFDKLKEKLKGHEFYTAKYYNADKTKTPKVYFEPYIPNN